MFKSNPVLDNGTLWGLIKYSKVNSWYVRPNHRWRHDDFLTFFNITVNSTASLKEKSNYICKSLKL